MKIYIPEVILDPEQAIAFAQFYQKAGNFYKHLSKLEKQTLFMLMVDTLETTVMDLISVSLQIPDSADDSIWLTIQTGDPDDEDTVCDSDETVGGAVIAFIEATPQLDYAGQFCTILAQPLTHENKWHVASSLFGKKIASQMEQAHLAKKTPQATSKTKTRRM